MPVLFPNRHGAGDTRTVFVFVTALYQRNTLDSRCSTPASKGRSMRFYPRFGQLRRLCDLFHAFVRIY